MTTYEIGPPEDDLPPHRRKEPGPEVNDEPDCPVPEFQVTDAGDRVTRDHPPDPPTVTPDDNRPQQIRAYLSAVINNRTPPRIDPSLLASHIVCVRCGRVDSRRGNKPFMDAEGKPWFQCEGCEPPEGAGDANAEGWPDGATAVVVAELAAAAFSRDELAADDYLAPAGVAESDDDPADSSGEEGSDNAKQQRPIRRELDPDLRDNPWVPR